MIDVLAHDLRYSIRSLRRRPGTTFLATLTLAIGFGANVAVFAVVDRLLLSAPAHVTRADRVFRLHIEVADVGGGRFMMFQAPYTALPGLQQSSRSFERLSAYRRTQASLGTGADATPITACFTEAGYFDLLGVAPALGRFFIPDEDRPPSGGDVAVISHTFWQTALGANSAILGQDVRIGTRTYRVVGIAPAGFSGDTVEPVDVWLPLHAAATELPATWTTSHTARVITLIGRLRDDVTREGATAEASDAYRRVIEGTRAADPTARVFLASLQPGIQIEGRLTPQARMSLWLQGVSLLVLLVAIANVVNLQITSAAERYRDTAVRLAIGANSGRLLRQRLIEAGLLATVAAAAAVAGAYWSATALQTLLTAAAGSVAINGRVLASAVLCVVAATLICGVPGGGRGNTAELATHLRIGRVSGTGGRSRLHGALLALQVAGSLVLLIGAGLFVKSMTNVNRLHYGLDPDRVLVAPVPLRQAGLTPAAIEAFFERALSEVKASPGIATAAAGLTSPFSPSLFATLAIPGFAEPPFTSANYPTHYAVTPEHFDTLGIRILRGRSFTYDDRAGAPPVIIIEQALGEHIWPGQDPIGRCIHIGGPAEPCRTIVGVASNTRRFVAVATGALRYYLPLAQRAAQAPPQLLLVRPAGDPVAAIPTVRAALQRVYGDLPYARIRVLSELAEPETRQWRLGSTLLTVLGAVALIVATFGVYGLLSAFVAARTREMGVRLALGATPSSLTWLVVRQSMQWISAGLAVGLAGALVGARYVEPLLFETRAFDTLVFAAAPLLLVITALIASAVPAWRAARVDPNLTLRAE